MRWGITVFAILLVLYLLSREDWDEITRNIRGLLGWPLFFSVLFLLASRLFVSLRWHQLLSSGGNAVPFTETIKLTFAGLFANNFLPSTVGGDVVRLAGGIKLGLGGSFTTATLIADRVLGTIGMFFFAPLGAIQILPALSTGGLASASVFSGKMASKIWSSMIDIWGRVRAALSLWIRKPGVLIRAELLNIFHLCCVFAAVWMLLRSADESISYWLVAGLWSFVYFITLIPITVNGLGLQEVSITFVLVQWGGIEDAHALVVALVFRLLFMLVSLPGALFIGEFVPDINRFLNFSGETVGKERSN
jgi:hypothetical protein